MKRGFKGAKFGRRWFKWQDVRERRWRRRQPCITALRFLPFRKDVLYWLPDNTSSAPWRWAPLLSTPALPHGERCRGGLGGARSWWKEGDRAPPAPSAGPVRTEQASSGAPGGPQHRGRARCFLAGPRQRRPGLVLRAASSPLLLLLPRPPACAAPGPPTTSCPTRTCAVRGPPSLPPPGPCPLPHPSQRMQAQAGRSQVH